MKYRYCWRFGLVIFAVVDKAYMQRCFELARRGMGLVSPNPLVGCVIVYRGEIIGEGYHQQIGGAHAEVNAIRSVKNQSLLSESTLYVNLEPCAHFGKTPPCAPLIVQHNIRKVVIGNRDPFSEVDGKGIQLLREAGIEVETDCEAEEGRWLNRRFFTYHTEHRPYIVLKWAQSADGFLDRERTENERGVNWITAPHTQLLTHRWRAQEDAILVGTRTALIDNPSLTTRQSAGSSPHRLLIDRNLKVSEDAHIFSSEAKTTVFNASKSSRKNHIEWVDLDFEAPLLPQIMRYAYSAQIQSILVEGGAHTLAVFVAEELWDEARIITGQPVFERGITPPTITGKSLASYSLGNDRITIMTRK